MRASQGRLTSEGISTSPESIASMMSWAGRPSMVQPTDWAVPRISLTPPASEAERVFLASRMVRAMSMMASSSMLPECLMFFSFLRSRTGSLRARMTSDEADGTTETAA
jgi:hypothetical protein